MQHREVGVAWKYSKKEKESGLVLQHSDEGSWERRGNMC